MRQLACAARWTAAAATVASVPLAASIGWLNRPWAPWDLLRLTAELWVLCSLVLAGPSLLLALATIVGRRTLRGRDVCALAITTLFALSWVGRLKPAHQPFASKPHLSSVGAIELLLIGASALAVYAAASRPASSASRRVLRTLTGLAVCSALLAGFARAVEPRPDRLTAISRLPLGIPEAPPPPRARVLLVGVDGLDWTLLQHLIQRGELPAITRLVEHGRFYQLDARGMSVSPQIWTALYTGTLDRRNAILGYTRWHFRSVSHPISFFPEFGSHPLLMIDVLLDATTGLGLWSGREASTADIAEPTVWQIASSAGRRVGVFDPVPFRAIGEHVDGRFAWRDGDRYHVEQANGEDVSTLEAMAPMATASSAAPQILSTELARAAVATDIVVSPDEDLAIYYTCFIDWLGHRGWDFHAPGRLFGGSATGPLDALFDRSTLAAGYRQIDGTVSRLIERFGQPAVVVLVSDHGWELNEYEHSLGPRGVLLISGAGATGYGGEADVLRVAPTVLSLLHLPIGAGMAPPLADVTRAWSTRRYGDLKPSFVVDPRRPDRERADLLRSLGYIAR